MRCPELLTLLQGQVACPRLHGVEFANRGDELGGGLIRPPSRFGNYRLSLDEIPPAMGPATEVRQTMGVGDAAIDLEQVSNDFWLTINRIRDLTISPRAH